MDDRLQEFIERYDFDNTDIGWLFKTIKHQGEEIENED